MDQLQPFLDFLNNGGNLNSIEALGAIAVLIRVVLLPVIIGVAKMTPALARFASKMQTVLGGDVKRKTACVLGVILVLAIDAATKQHIPLDKDTALGIGAGLLAIGFHQTTANA